MAVQNVKGLPHFHEAWISFHGQISNMLNTRQPLKTIKKLQLVQDIAMQMGLRVS